jgi:hypothetical protein
MRIIHSMNCSGSVVRISSFLQIMPSYYDMKKLCKIYYCTDCGSYDVVDYEDIDDHDEEALGKDGGGK